MGVTAIFVMWPRCSTQTLVPSTHWGSIWNLALIGPVISEEKQFQVWTTDDDGRTDDDRQMTEPAYTISSAMSLKATTGELSILVEAHYI